MTRKIWIDYLKVIAAFAVIAIHISSPYYKEVDPMNAPEWWLANIMNAFSRFCVPMFVMISGALILGRDESPKDFYMKRALRLVPAILFWSAFYMAFRYFYLEDHTKIFRDLKGGIILSGRAYYHLWYLSMFLCLMAFVPLLNSFILGKKPGARDMYLVAGVTGLFMLLSQISSIEKAFFDETFKWFNQVPWFVGYLLLGYLIQQYHEHIRVNNYVLFGTFLLCGAIGVVGNYIAVRNGIVMDYLILSNTNILTMIMTLSLFTLFAKNAARLPDLKIISMLSIASFGIYLIHPVFIKIMAVHMKPFMAHGITYMPISLMIVFTVSAIVSMLLLKVPGMKKVM